MKQNDESVVRMTVCACLALVLPVVVEAAHSVSTVPELVAALEAINAGTTSDLTVEIAPGTYDVSSCNMKEGEGCLFIAKDNVILVGADATSWRTTADRNTKVVLDAKRSCRVLYKDPKSTGCQMQNLTFQNGYSTSYGGAVYFGTWNSKDVVLTNCVFRDNETNGGQGGAGFRFVATDCYFTNNVSTTSGGGALVSSSPLVDCLFEDNRAKTEGGAVSLSTAITNCIFIGNQTLVNGSGGAACTGNGVIFGCVFSNNVSATTGGAVKNYNNDDLEIVGCRFEGNRAAGDGGAVNGATLLSDCGFVGNSTEGDGGAFCVTSNKTVAAGTETIVLRCAFTNNVSSKNGGAICGHQSNPLVRLSVCDSDFLGNESQKSGGAVIYCTSVSNCAFASCTAKTTGGGAFTCGLVDACRFVSCTTKENWGGGGCNGCAVRKSQFVDCGCATNEQTVAAFGGTFENCDFQRCHLREPVYATNCRIVGNGVDQKSMGMGKCVLTNCLVTGLCCDYLFAASTHVNCTIISNNIGTTGQLTGGSYVAKNCIFVRNYTKNGVDLDVAGFGSWELVNCTFQDAPRWSSLTINSTGTVCTNNVKALFWSPGQKHFDPNHPYKLRRNSPARNAGCAIDWPEDAKDLAGNARIYHGDPQNCVDIGCYEFSLPPDGFMCIFH